MCRDHHGAPLGRQLTERCREFSSSCLIERRGWLVHEKNCRLHRERTSNGDTLSLTAGQLVRHGIRAFADAKHVEQRLRAPLGVCSRLPEHVHRRQPDVLQSGEVREEMMELEDEADRPLYLDGPGCDRIQPSDGAQHCRLSGAGHSHESHELAPLGSERDAVDDDPVSAFDSEIANDQRHGRRQPFSTRRASRASGSDNAR